MKDNIVKLTDAIDMVQIGLRLYSVVITERLFALIMILLVGSFPVTHIVAGLLSIVAGIATFLLFSVRVFDLIYPHILRVYRLNRIHAVSDLLVIVLFILTGAGNSILFILYSFFAIMWIVYDVLANIVMTVAPKYCLSNFNTQILSIHAFGYKNYIRYRFYGTCVDGKEIKDFT